MHLQFGDADKIIVECVAKPDSALKRGLWFGFVWLRVDGQVIGNVEDRFQEHIGIALGGLLDAAHDTGKRQCRLLHGLSSQAALDLVMWAVYGDDEAHPEITDVDRKLLATSEILPFKGGPTFDGWQAIIVESGDTETIIWRRERESTHSHTLPLGTFWAAIELAQMWLRSENSDQLVGSQ